MSGPSSGGPVVVDLFAGAGGLSLGAEAAGCDVRLAVDFDHLACETMRRNTAGTGLQILETDVSALSGGALRELARVRNSDPLVIVGGPPCQGFSKAAFWTEEGEDARYRQARARGEDARRPPTPLSPPNKDKRRSLIFEYWRLVAESDANGFVFENVPSLLAPRHRPMFDRLVDLAEDAGFKTTLVKANAAEFGVAQKRKRIFLLGAKDFDPVAPTPTHSLEPTDGLLPALTAGQALKRLHSPRFHEPEEIVKGRWAKHLEEIPPGWNYKWHTEWAGHPNPTFVTETRYWHFLLKLSPDLPSWTIAANPGPWTGPFHWSSRRLRTVELAALQGFPGEYEFAGSRRERVRQIGNAVPPPLAAHMVEAIASKVRADFVVA